MTIQAVHTGIELAIFIPTDAEIIGIEIDIAYSCRRLNPVNALGDAAPERIRVTYGLGIVKSNAFLVGIGLGGEFGRGRDVVDRRGHVCPF